MNCPTKNCNGRVMMVDAFNSGAVDYDFECSDGCDWICADAERSAAYRAQMKKQTPKKKHPKRVEFKPDSAELVAAIRAEVQRQMEILMAERKKLPKKLNTKQRNFIHQFAVNPEQIREELINA